MLIRTKAVFAADAGGAAGGDGAGAAGAAGGAPGGSGGAPAGPDWLPQGLTLDKQFLGETAADTISRLHNAYAGSRKAISEFGVVPENAAGYKFDITPELEKLFGGPEDKGIGALREALLASGITDRHASKLLTNIGQSWIKAGLMKAPPDPLEEGRKMLGPSFTGTDEEVATEVSKRLDATDQWLDGLASQKMLDREGADALKSLAQSATGLKAIEALRKLETARPGGFQPNGAPTGQRTKEELQQMMRDPRYFSNSSKFDPDYARDVERQWKELHARTAA